MPVDISKIYPLGEGEHGDLLRALGYTDSRYIDYLLLCNKSPQQRVAQHDDNPLLSLTILWVRNWGGTCRQAQRVQGLTPQNSPQPRVMGSRAPGVCSVLPAHRVLAFLPSWSNLPTSAVVLPEITSPINQSHSHPCFRVCLW